MLLFNFDFCSMKELEELLIFVLRGWDVRFLEIIFGILLDCFNK